MSTIHDRVMVAMANTPGKQRTVGEITRYVNKHFIPLPYTEDEVESALADLADEKTVTPIRGRWMMADSRRRGSVRPMPEKPAAIPSLRMVDRVNRR